MATKKILVVSDTATTRVRAENGELRDVPPGTAFEVEDTPKVRDAIERGALREHVPALADEPAADQGDGKRGAKSKAKTETE